MGGHDARGDGRVVGWGDDLGGRSGKGVGGCTGGLSRDERLDGGSKVVAEKTEALDSDQVPSYRVRQIY